MMPDRTATTKDDVAAQNAPHRIHDKLAEQGFTDINIVPGSYTVNGKGQERQPAHDADRTRLDDSDEGAPESTSDPNTKSHIIQQ